MVLSAHDTTASQKIPLRYNKCHSTLIVYISSGWPMQFLSFGYGYIMSFGSLHAAT